MTNATTALGQRAPETKSQTAAPAATGGDTAALIAAMDRQTAAIASMSPAAAEAKSAETAATVTEIKNRALQTLRDAAGDKKSARDPLTQQKMDRINASIDDVERRELARLREENARLRIKSSRPPGPNGRDPLSAASSVSAKSMLRAAGLNYLRTGETMYKGQRLRDLEAKAATRGVNADGGYLVVPEYDEGPIEKALRDLVPWRQHFDVRPMHAAEIKKPFRTATGGAVWGTELSNGGERPAPTWDLLSYSAHDLYAELQFTRDLAEDAGWDIEMEIADAAKDDFADTEATVFVTGDGSGKPKGFLGHVAGDYVDNAAWAWGKIGWVKTGDAANLTGDSIIGLGYSLAAAYRQNAKFVMQKSTIHKCRVLKGSDGHYLWSNGNMVQGQPSTLDGREVVEAEAMPGVAAGTYPVLIADTKRFYTIYDRLGMQVLRDESKNGPTKITYYVRKRVAGGVKDFKAGKLLKVAA